MEKSRKFSKFNNKNANHKWTIFTYNLNNDIGIHSATLGIQSLYNNIKKVFLLCNEINSIKINNEELLNLSMISTKSLKIYDDLNYNIIEKNIKDEKFVIASFEEANQQYLEKYSKDSGKEFSTEKLAFNILIPVNSNRQIIERKDNEICLFCTFPLIGSEKCQLPYVINCPVFETSTERKGLILDGEEKDSDGILTNTGLNYLILNKSINLFSIVIDWFIENNYSNFACFSNGILLNSEQMNPFIHKISSILENKPIVKDSSNQPLPLNMVLFLDFNNIKDKKAFYDLASSFYLNVASYDDCIKWNNKTWNELSILNIKTFVENVKCIGNNELHIKRNKNLFTDGLSSLTKNDFSFLNRFYSFLLNEETKSKTFIDIAHNSLFLKEKIILNSNCQFDYLIKLKSNSKLSEDLNKIMEQCESWNDSIIHPEIKSFKSLIPEETIDNAKQAIDYYIKNNDDIDVLLSFVKFVLKNDKQGEKMYQIANFFYNVPMKIIVTDVDSNIWEKVDFYLLKHINNKISMKLNSKIDESSLKYYKIFYKLYHQICCETDFLVPNYNLKLTKLNQLKFLSKEIPQVLIDAIKSFSDFDSYIHPSIKCDFLKNEVDDLDYFINLFKSEDFFFSDNEEIIKDRLFAILSIIPPEKNKRLYNFQLKIREIAQFFFNENIKKTKTNIKDETFWETADEIVIEYIIKNLKKYKTIQCLKSQFDDDEANIFEYLNYFYSIISSNYKEKKDIVLIPNHNGNFLRSDELSIGKGLDEKLYDLINKTNSEFDIRDKIAHPKVQCDFLKIMDFEYFIKLLNEKLSEEQLLNDKNMVDAIFSDLNIFDEHSRNIFERLYVANIKNRLNEIKNPTDSDKIRWPMELMQNAKDSLYSHSNINKQKDVEINIEVSYKRNKPIKVCFSHNGPAFTENSFYGLIFKICEGKDNLKSTGKFGTGFISTHVLSKIVNISGNRIDQNNKITGFSITLYREGTKDNDIIKDFKKMSKSFKSFQNDSKFTKFEYQITSKNSIECVELGLIHFKNHISNVLINCKEIKCVNLYENDKKTTFSASKIFKQQYNQFLYLKYQTFSNNDLLKQFILIKNEEKISISIEYDNDNCKIIPRNKETESIFSVFPLVGSKAHILPFFLNSSNLEPVTERNALILHGKEEINGETTNTGKNRSIMMNSINLFEELIQILNEKKCSNMYELTYGLLLSTNPYESFDIKWYTNTYLKKIRKVILNNIEAKTFFGESILLKDISFPSNKISDKYIRVFIKLSSRFYNNIISVEDALLWRHRLWNTIDMISIEDLIDKVQNDDSIINEKKLFFLNEFLSFIWNFNKDILYNYELIPDMNCDFHKLSNDSYNLRECKTVSKKIIKMMESIKIPWKSTHMNNFITTISLSEDKIADAEGKIIEQIKQKNELSLIMMKFVLPNNKLRQNMYEFVNELKIKKFKKPIKISDIDPKVWELADNYTLKLIVSKIELFNSKKVCNLNDFFTRFLPIFFDQFSRDKTFINSKKIIPNANCNLYSLNELCKKSDCFHVFLNPILIKYFDYDFNEKIFHPQIVQYIDSSKEESIIDFLKIINANIKTQNKKNKKKIAETVISIIPTNINHISTLDEPREIFSLYHDLVNLDIEEVIIDENLYKPFYWEKSKKIIIQILCKKVEEAENLEEFQNCFDLDDENEAFEKLNLLYKFDLTHKIVPNKKGDFMYRKDLKANPGIKDDIIECISMMNPDSVIINEMVHNKVSIFGLQTIDILEFINKFNQLYNSTENKANIDSKINEIINNIYTNNPFFISSDEMVDKTNDDLVRLEILQNLHISTIKNKLRELNNPSNDDYKRWPFELIQNARDCVRDSNQKVNITFEFEKNYVNFIHDGIPFNIKNLYALLYQCTEGKDDNKLSVGRFGTGFMATHILSRIIHISGDLEQNIPGKEKIVGFDVTINREGNKKKELKEGIKKMEKSKKITKKIKGFTKFQFDMSKVKLDGDSQNAKAYNQGLLALISNIPQVLILNPTIESITLKAKGKTIKYVATHENGFIQTVTKSENKKEKISTFIMVDKNKNFNCFTNIMIQCLLQIDENNSISNNNYFDFLYLCYPMFGDNHFYSPIIINSPNFEPDDDRKNLLIQQCKSLGKEGDESLKNKFIISESVDIFKQIIQIAIDKKCNNLFNLCNGLKHDSNINYIQNNFVVKMRNTLMSFPIFQTQNQFQKIDAILIPYIDDYNKFTLINQHNNTNSRNRLYEEFYQLVSKLSIDSKYYVNYNDCLKWNQLLWSDFPSKIDVVNFLEFISKHDNISDLNFTCNEPKEEYINKVIIFIEKMKDCDNILYEYKILINKDGDLKTKDEIFYFNLPNEFIEMFDIVKFDYNETMLHKSIEHIYSNKNIKFKQFDILTAIKTIKDRINEENAQDFIKYVIKDSACEQMFFYTQKILRTNYKKVYLQLPTEVEKEDRIIENLNDMFRKVNKIVSNHLIQYIQKNFDIDETRNNIKTIKGFIKFISKILSFDEFKELKIIPAQNYELRSFHELNIDNICNEELKKSLSILFDYDLPKYLVHDSFKSLFKYDRMNFKKLSKVVIPFLKNIFETNESDRIKFYTIVLKNPFFYDKDIQTIIDLVQFFFKQIIDFNFDDLDEDSIWSAQFTKDISEIIINDITRKISKYNNINEMVDSEKLNILYDKLSILYLYTHHTTDNKIFPNFDNDLKYKNEIKILHDRDFDNDTLLTLLDFFAEFDESFDIKKSFLNQLIKIHEEILNQFKVVDMNYIKELIKNFIQKNHGKNYTKFFDFIYKSSRLKIVFADLINERKEKISPKILANIDMFNKFFHTYDDDDDIELFSNIISLEETRETGYFGEAAVYEEMKKSKKFSLVKWLALSDVETDISIEVNGKTYYINEKGEHYDIYAEDFNKNEYFIEVKSTKFNNKLAFYISDDQINCALDKKNNFYFALVKDARCNPQIIWLNYNNPLED